MRHKAVNSQRSRFFSSDGSLRPSIRMARLFSKIFRTIFKKRKILIISDKKITSIPFTPSMQVSLMCVALVVTAWVSYTGGKNLHYQEALDAKERTLHEKERQIAITNLANKDLLSQVSDLHRDLKRLNTYFENISEYDGRLNGSDKQADSKKKLGADKNAALEPRLGNEVEVLSRKDIVKIRETAHNTLGTINQGVIDRVKKLEAAIAMTGLKLNAVTEVSYKIDNTPLQPYDEGGAMGGPFEAQGKGEKAASPFDINTNLDANIDYLLHLEEVINSMPLAYPIKNARVTSRFGTRIDPFRHRKAAHYGLDFAGPFNSRVLATAPGRVIRTGRYGAYGNFVEIAHGNGISTRYGHLNRISVYRGQKVARGDLVGLQGNTGRSTGTHLHYEVRHQGKPYNPENFLKAGNYVHVLQENNG